MERRSTWPNGGNPVAVSSALLCEHHTASDGYLPSPTLLASAMAARTSSLPITIAVVLLPLYDPVRLAEEMVVLDIISKGRVSFVAAIGYRPVEYEMYGVDYHNRGRIAEEKLGVLLQAKTGEPFEYQGRRIHVTPAPVTSGGPFIAWGGGSVAAARRAGRHGIGFFAQKGIPHSAWRTKRHHAKRDMNQACASCRRSIRRPPSSWPRTSIGPGRSSART